MIRLPPSVVCLAPSDLLDYEDRRKQRTVKAVEKLYSKFEVGVQDEDKFGRAKKSTVFQYDFPTRNPSRALYPSVGGADSSEDQSSLFSCQETPENISIEVQQYLSSPKDPFQYGGFLENFQTQSSPFAPDDISTPSQNLYPPSSQGYRSRNLPRSPLYLSHNASSSPEGRPTSSLTPRVTSRVANHNAPGFIFSQPARRPNFRHQTNSFSFDSERASAVYEQDRMSSLSTTDTTPRPAYGVRLHEELRGSSLSSSQVSTEIELQQQFSEESEGLEEESTFEPPEMQDSGGTSIFSSPRLPLPAPFSTTSRSVSDAESLPSSPRNLGASLIRSALGSPNRSSVPDNDDAVEEHRPRSSNSSRGYSYPSERREGTRRFTPVKSEPTSSNQSVGVNSRKPSPVEFIRSGAARIVSFYKPRSPVRNQRAQSLLAHYPSTLSRNLSVYNDELPPATQPQTPAHVPEARHQSRYHPSYTAPITRARSGLLSVLGHTPERQERPPATPSHAARDRAGSPLGLQTGGFRGLYGGRENGDEEQNWVEGVRFDNAEVRLWGLRDAAADGRTLGDTPEREEWRFGQH